MSAAAFLYPLLILADVLLIVGADGRVKYALFVFLAMHILCWFLSGKGSLRTLGFYVSLGLAWLVVGGYALDSIFLVRSLVAIAILFVAFLTWGNGSVGAGYRPPKAHAKSGFWRRARLLLPASVLGAGAFLLMADPIPRSTKIIMELGSGLRDMAAPFLQGFTGEADAPDEAELNPNNNITDAEDGRDFGVRRKLPNSADLRTGTDLHVYLTFPDLQQLNEAIRRRPYVRQLVLNGYSDGEWFHIPGAERLISDEDDGNTDGRTKLMQTNDPGITYEVYAIESTGRSLPFLTGVVETSFPNIVEVLDGWYQAGVPGNVTYDAVSSPLRFEDIPATEPLRSGVVSQEYLEVNNRELLRQLRSLLAETGNASTPLRERLLAIRTYMRQNYSYSTKVENLGALPPVENFLFHEKKGYCDFFATAGALLCRAMGLPARTAYGFAQGEVYREDRVIGFRGNHAHSWTEIYLDGYGWVVYDLTPPGSDATAPSPQTGRDEVDLSSFSDARSQSNDADDQKGILSYLRNLPPKFISGAIIAGFLLLAILRFIDRYQDKQQKRKGESRRRRSDRKNEYGFDYDPYPAYLLDFRKLCRLLGCKDDDGDTLMELIHKLTLQGIELNSEFDSMRQYHYQVRYEGQRQDSSLEKAFRKRIREFWKAYKQ